MTTEDFRRLALELPEATENSHHGHPDFRVRKKIFATLGYPDQEWAMVKLTTAQQRAFRKAAPAMFSPVKGAWGEKGATNVVLQAAKPDVVRRALVTAWKNVAPKSLAAEFDEAGESED